MKDFVKKFIIMMVMSVVIGLTFALVFDYLQPEIPTAQAIAPPSEPTVVTAEKTFTAEERSVIDIVESLKNSIVSVNTSTNAYGEEQLIGSGSGVAYREDESYSYIITNDHVVANGDSFTIDLVDGTRVPVTLIGNDKDTELAVLRVSKADLGQAKLTLAPLGKSENLVVGENVLAIGNALGYGQSVTKGIVSAIDRELAGYRGGYAYKMIQTDAPINPGNSGGALVNSQGEVVGINTIKIADAKVEGVGFAIPIEPAKEISDSLMELGYLPKTFLGISSQYISPQVMAQNNLPLGTIVFGVTPNSPASRAGIQREDIIVKVDDQETPDIQTLSFIILSHNDNDQVILSVYRNGEVIQVPVTLEKTSK